MDMLIDRFLLKSLRHGKKAKLSIIEKFFLRRTGRKDGRYCLPRENSEGMWTSPTIQREINACNETLTRICGILQVKLEEKYTKAAKLADKIKYYEMRINVLKQDMPAPLTEEDCNARKHGEEKLTNSQIYNRRMREYKQSVNGIQTQIDKLREEVDADYEELIDLKSYLAQKNYETEFVCNRIRSHTQQRIDYYWNAASHISYESERNIPAVFDQLPIWDVLDSYKQFHKEKESAIEKLINQYGEGREGI